MFESIEWFEQVVVFMLISLIPMLACVFVCNETPKLIGALRTSVKAVKIKRLCSGRFKVRTLSTVARVTGMTNREVLRVVATSQHLTTVRNRTNGKTMITTKIFG